MINDSINPANIPLPSETWPSAAEITYSKMSPNYAWSELFRAVISQAVLLGGLIAASFIITLPILTKLQLLAGFFMLSLLQLTLTFARARRTVYAVRSHDLHFRSGLLWVETISVPFNRIQHVDLASGPVTRFFDLAIVKFYTAGSRTYDLRIAGLATADASKLHELILRKLNPDRGEL